MKPISHHSLIAVFGILAGMAWTESGMARTWTDVNGRKIEASLVAQNDSGVVLRLKNGKNATVPLKRLSKGDIEFLENGGEEDGEPDTDPPETADADESKDDGEDALNWNDPWPVNVPFKDNPGIDIVEEDADAKRFIYTSSNYRFTCDVRLSKSVVSTFADMFETTRLYCRALPLAITGGDKHDGKFDILLFAEKENYIKAGAPPSSAGVFMGGRGVVMVPLVSLGVKKVGSGYMRDRDKSDGTLIHELTHQLTPSVYYAPGARGWFSEGLAEYLTATPYRYGRFKVKNNLDDIVAYATAYGKKNTRGRALGDEISAPSLKTYMLMSYSDFTGSKANFNYGFGLLISTYFMVLDGEGDAARLKEFLKELRKIGRGGDSTKALDKLLDGRSFKELEEDIYKAWKRKRVKIIFPD